MGEHRLKSFPNPEAAAQVPKFEWQVGSVLDTKIVPKTRVCLIPQTAEIVEATHEGVTRKFVKLGETVAAEPLPKDAIPVREGDPIEHSMMDLCVYLRIDYTKGSVMLAGGGLPQAQVRVIELYRTDLEEFRQACEQGLQQRPPSAPLARG